MCVCAPMQSSSCPGRWKNSDKDIHDVHMSLRPCEVEVTHILCADTFTHCNLNQVKLPTSCFFFTSNKTTNWGLKICEVAESGVKVYVDLSNTSFFSVLSLCLQPKLKLYHAKSAETNHQVSTMESLRVRDVRWDFIQCFIKPCFVWVRPKTAHSIMHILCSTGTCTSV